MVFQKYVICKLKILENGKTETINTQKEIIFKHSKHTINGNNLQAVVLAQETSQTSQKTSMYYNI